MNKNFSRFDTQVLISEFNRDNECINKAEQILKTPIRDFYNHYTKAGGIYERLEKLEKDEDLCAIMNDLSQNVLIHSIRSRIMHPYHLTDKIINIACHGKEYGGLNIENYHLYIDNLLEYSFSILHQEDWERVHDAIVSHFKFDSSKFKSKSERSKDDKDTYIVEPPKIYMRDGVDESIYTNIDENIRVIKDQYTRLICYVVFFKGFCIKIQVKSLFDKALVSCSKMLKRVPEVVEESNVPMTSGCDTCEIDSSICQYTKKLTVEEVIIKIIEGI